MTLVQFKEQYEKHFGRQLKLAEYGAKKLIQLFEAVPDTVKVNDMRFSLECSILI